MAKNKELLSSYIQKVLLVEYGDALGDLSMVDPKDMAKIFVKPFTDLAKTAEKVIGQLSSRTKGLVKVLARGITSTIVPGISNDYSSIFKKEEAELKKLEQKYANVLQHTRETLKNDARLLAFLLSPITFLSGMVSIGSVKSARKSIFLVDELSGSNRYVKYNVSTLLKRLKRTTSEYEKYLKRENKILFEEDETRKILEQIRDFVLDDRTQHIMKNSKIVRSMRQDAEETISATTNQLKNKINEIDNINSFEVLESYIGKNLLGKNEEEAIPEDEIEEAKELFMMETKESMLETYLKLVNENIKEMNSLNIPEGSLLLDRYVELQEYIMQKLDDISA